jgi:RimJ/RimL family protein N-acetyltransferase
MSLPFAIPVLETERLTLREPRESDLDAMAAFGASPRNRFVGGMHDRFGAWRALVGGIGHWALKGYGYWSVDRRADGAFIGRVGVIFPPTETEAELAYHLFDGFEGHGYATEAALAARRHCQGVMGMAPLVSFIDAENAPSIAVATRLGAVLESQFPEDDRIIQLYRHPVGAA